MGIDGLITLLQSEEFQSLSTAFTVLQFTGSVLSKIAQFKKNYKKNSHEWQLINCMEQALLETQNSLQWENDSNAIAETFFDSLFTFKDKFNENALTDIFKNAVGHEVTDGDINEWIHQFLKQLSLNEHTALREYLKVRNLLRIGDVQQTKPIGRILTPLAPQWVKDGIICRDELIYTLCEELSNGIVHLQLVGMGGIGKTEILNRIYANLATYTNNSFDYIGLFSYTGNIEMDLVQQLDYPKQYKRLPESVAAWRFLQDICNEKSVLLLVDDIREKKDLITKDDTLLTLLQSLHASVLMASRTNIKPLLARDVDALSTDACIRVFEKQYGRCVDTEEISVLTEIIEQKAGRNTLIVNRLGSMAKDYGWSVRELCDRLTKNNFKITKGIRDDELLQQEINKVYVVGENISAAEQNILEAFSAFPKIPLTIETCVDWLSADAALEPDNCRLHLMRLSEQTWLEKHRTADGQLYYSMHQMVTAAVKAQLTIELKNHETLVEKCADSISMHTDQYELNEASRLAPFASSIYDCLCCEDPLIANLSSSIGQYNNCIANYSVALTWHHKALAIREKVLGLEHSSTATTYNDIAGLYESQGEYTNALEWYQKDLAICEKVLGKEHPSTATAYNNIAGVYSRKGDYQKALVWYQKALAISEKVLGKKHPSTAITNNNIALVYSQQGDYPKALEWYQKALVIKEKVLGTEHPSTAKTYNNIALVYDSQGDYPKALEWYLKALAIKEKVLGTEHPSTATTYNNIALVYFRQGDYPKALEWYQKALAICEKVLGKEHPNTATSYNNIAGVYDNQGDYTKALEWYQKDLAICEKMLGKEHPDTATSYNNIAGVYFRQGDYPKALEWYQKALNILSTKLGADHPYVKSVLHSINAIEKVI